ncbi:hypothetical protein JCM33374_g2686 [Metschnikowia sp. JCM 33374]|nr:hypothetical protein JCM33374_g2686 [Metschnikowia sp. JCM 33374]
MSTFETCLLFRATLMNYTNSLNHVTAVIMPSFNTPPCGTWNFHGAGSYFDSIASTQRQKPGPVPYKSHEVYRYLKNHPSDYPKDENPKKTKVTTKP